MMAGRLKTHPPSPAAIAGRRSPGTDVAVG